MLPRPGELFLHAFLRGGRQRRNPPIGRIDNQRCPQASPQLASRDPTKTGCRRDSRRLPDSIRDCRRCCAGSSRARYFAASCGVKNCLPANSAGRSSGVMVALVQMPCEIARRLAEKNLRREQHHAATAAFISKRFLSAARAPPEYRSWRNSPRDKRTRTPVPASCSAGFARSTAW